MSTYISKYFKAESAESLLFILVGLAAIGLSLYLWMRIQQPFYSGMAWPLVSIAMIQLVVGTTVYLRSPKDIARVESIVAIAPDKIRTEEIPRMEVVMKNFELYKYLEIGLIISGIGLYFLVAAAFWKGVGAGLAIQSAFMLVLDFFAMSRGREYLEQLLNQ
jgi:hypothetical protein